MSDFVPKAGAVKRGLGPAAQRLEAARAKAAAKDSSGGKHAGAATNVAAKATSSFAGGKKPSFQRKAV